MKRRAFLGSSLAFTALGSTRRESAGLMLVVDTVNSSLDVFDNRTFARLTRIALEKRPREVVVAPGGSMAYVTIYGPGIYGDNPTPGREIAAIDPATRKVTKKIGLGPHVGPHGMAMAPDGRLWVTCEVKGSLLLIDPSAKTQTKTIPATVPLGIKGAYWVAVSPDGSKVYATSQEHPLLSVVDARERRLIREIKTPGGLAGLAIAPDGRRLFASALGKASLWVIDAREDRVVREFPIVEPATRLKAFDGGLIVAHDESGTIEVFDVPSLRKRGTANVGKSPSGMAISPDGKIAYVASFVQGTVTLLDLGSLRTIRTVDVGGGPDGIALAQD